MKIAIIYDVIYPYVKGGVEKRVWELAGTAFPSWTRCPPLRHEILGW